jgi:hypothetical protein
LRVRKITLDRDRGGVEKSDNGEEEKESFLCGTTSGAEVSRRFAEVGKRCSDRSQGGESPCQERERHGRTLQVDGEKVPSRFAIKERERKRASGFGSTVGSGLGFLGGGHKTGKQLNKRGIFV